jgi:hypothetical protein
MYEPPIWATIPTIHRKTNIKQIAQIIAALERIDSTTSL